MEQGFANVEHVLREEIKLYLDETETHAILLHKPLCVASERRNEIPIEWKIRPGMSAAVLCNVSRMFRGQLVLCPTDQFMNPCNAIMAFQTFSIGYHQGRRQCAAYFRDFVSQSNVFALKDNGLAKTTIPNAPVAACLREKTYANAATAKTTRKNDFSVVKQSACILSRAKPGKLAGAYKAIMKLFKSGHAAKDASSFQSSRFSQLKKNYVATGSDLYKELNIVFAK